jgi:rubrerythrin
MSQLPAGAPDNAGAAFARINAVTAPTIDDLKLMVYIEASGKSAYEALAQTTANAEIQRLLEANGREEMAHAHRVAKAIKLLSGEDFEPPAAQDNPYVSPSAAKVDRALLEYLVKIENNGDDLYQTWADNTANAEAAALFRQNGKEEARHGERAAQALTLLDA